MYNHKIQNTHFILSILIMIFYKNVMFKYLLQYRRAVKLIPSKIQVFFACKSIYFTTESSMLQ